MKKTTIIFLSLKDLWDFRQAIQANHIEINTKNKSITCDCSEEHIKLAINKFNGKVAKEADA